MHTLSLHDALPICHDQGYPVGGWSKSWAYWIYNGTGGPVCTRTVEEIPNGDGTNRLVLDTNP